jgi:hypothetical protein
MNSKIRLKNNEEDNLKALNGFERKFLIFLIKPSKNFEQINFIIEHMKMIESTWEEFLIKFKCVLRWDDFKLKKNWEEMRKMPEYGFGW